MWLGFTAMLRINAMGAGAFFGTPSSFQTVKGRYFFCNIEVLLFQQADVMMTSFAFWRAGTRR
jgi:hypothetical protein